MKKFLKIMAVAAIAVAAAIACVFVGCNKDNGDGGDGGKLDYNFSIVYKGGDKDGQAVNGQTDGDVEDGKVFTQFCIEANCFPLTVYPNANGQLNLTQAQVNAVFNSETDVTVFDFHVKGVPDADSDFAVSVNGTGDYTVEVILG